MSLLTIVPRPTETGPDDHAELRWLASRVPTPEALAEAAPWADFSTVLQYGRDRASLEQADGETYRHAFRVDIDPPAQRFTISLVADALDMDILVVSEVVDHAKAGRHRALGFTDRRGGGVTALSARPGYNVKALAGVAAELVMPCRVPGCKHFGHHHLTAQYDPAGFAHSATVTDSGLYEIGIIRDGDLSSPWMVDIEGPRSEITAATATRFASEVAAAATRANILNTAAVAS